MEKVLRVLYFVIPVQVFLLIIAGLVWMGLETTEEVISMPDFSGILWDVVIGIITSLVGTVLTTVAMWFAFLRRIPQKTEEKVNKLLNERLNYETTNHNAVMQALNPNTTYLSGEHARLSEEHTHLSGENTRLSDQISFECGDIRDRVTEVHTHLRVEKAVAEGRQAQLTAEQRDIKKYVEGLAGFERNMEVLQEQLVQTKERSRELERTVEQLRGELEKEKSQNRQLLEQLLTQRGQEHSQQRGPQTPPQKRDIDYDEPSL